MRSLFRSGIVVFLALSSGLAAFAQDAEDPGTDPPKPTRPKASKSAKPRRLPAVNKGQLTALESALTRQLKEEHRSPLVTEEEDTGDEEQTILSLGVLDRTLDSLLKRKGLEPLLEPSEAPETGLKSLLDQLSSGELRPRERQVPSETPSSAPPPSPRVTPAPVASTPPPAPDEPSASTRYQLVKILVKRDGASEVEIPVGTGPVSVEHHGGTPPVDLTVSVEPPSAIILGQPVVLSLKGEAKGTGVTAELGLVRESLQPVTAAADSVSSAGRVNFAFVRKVGGIYAYQQTFAQLEGGKTPPPSLINWSERERTIQLEFSWATTAPATLHIDGRLIYQRRR